MVAGRQRQVADEEALWQANVGLVEAFLDRFAHNHDDDLRSDLYLALLTAIRNYDPRRGRLTTLAFTCFFNATSHYRRTLARRKTHVVLVERTPDRPDPGSAAGRTDYDVRMEALDRLLSDLPEPERYVLVQRYWVSPRVKLAEIADTLGLSTSRVGQIEKQALQRLREGILESVG